MNLLIFENIHVRILLIDALVVWNREELEQRVWLAIIAFRLAETAPNLERDSKAFFLTILLSFDSIPR